MLRMLPPATATRFLPSGKLSAARGTLRIERDKARDSRTLLAALARKNAVLPHEEDEAIKLVEQAIKSEPRRHRLHVRRLGWLPGRRGFALKNESARRRRWESRNCSLQCGSTTARSEY